jgi:hypothetical protein
LAIHHVHFTPGDFPDFFPLTQDLESHFNSISLRPGARTHSVSIQERTSPDDSPGRRAARNGTNGAAAPNGDAGADGLEPEIEIPEGISAGMPSIGLASANISANGAELLDPAAAGGDGARNGGAAGVPFAQRPGGEPADSAGGARAGGAADAAASDGGVPMPVLSGSMGFDEFPGGLTGGYGTTGSMGELLDADELQDILKDGAMLDYPPPDDDTWQEMLVDMAAGTPPP